MNLEVLEALSSQGCRAGDSSKAGGEAHTGLGLGQTAGLNDPGQWAGCGHLNSGHHCVSSSLAGPTHWVQSRGPWQRISAPVR